MWQSGESPLHVAIQSCHFPVVEEVLKHLEQNEDGSVNALVNLQNTVTTVFVLPPSTYCTANKVPFTETFSSRSLVSRQSMTDQ